MKKYFLLLLAVSLILSIFWFSPLRWLSPVAAQLDIYNQGTAKQSKSGHWIIEVDNYSDSYFYIGYLMAHDRLFQMELTRRLVQGRLSEIIGEKALIFRVIPSL